MQDYDEPFEDVDPTEESIDFQLSGDSFSDLIVAPADWTIGSLFHQIGKQIDLDPAFQRRNVWSPSAKSRFIESLFLGIPIPQILLSSRAGQKNSFLVLDGKQRLLTLKEFLDGDFRLKGLRVLHELEGVCWPDIENDPQWSDRLLNETQRTAVIRNWKSEKVLYEIFFRLNSGSVKLSPMELRMSLHPGKFLRYIIQWTETVGPLHQLLSKKKPDPRMNDVELAVRFLGFARREIEYRGDLKKFLDNVCIHLNELFTRDDGVKQEVAQQLAQMSKGIDAGMRVFGEKRFCRKVVNGEYESRFNRAVFDVLVAALSIAEVRRRALEDPDRFKAAYLEASKNPRFRTAVETSTKTAEATRTRFELFFSQVENKLGIELDLPWIQEPEETNEVSDV